MKLRKFHGAGIYRCLPALFLCAEFVPAINVAAELRRPELFNAEQRSVWIDFTEAPPMPLRHGVSGAYVGTSGERLVVAGGSFFSTPLSADSRKEYSEQILTLNQSATGARWSTAGKLPFPIAHGAAVSTADGIVCAGGENEAGPLDLILRIVGDSAAGDQNLLLIRCGR